MKTVLNAALVKSWFLHIFFPRTCFLCGADMARMDYNPLCPECKPGLKPVKGLVCKRCGLPLKYGGAFCRACSKKKNFKCMFIRSSFEFTPASRALVHAFKYQGYINIAKFFAPFMFRTLRANPEFFETDLLVPVPVHKSKFKERGFNQAALLARELAALSDIPCAELLERKEKTKSQTSLGRADRLKNIKNAFVCNNRVAVKGSAVILIDDVCTTSATLEECARVLKRAGAREVLAITALRE